METTSKTYKPKVLIYSQGQLLIDAASLIHNRFDFTPIQVRDSKQVLSSVYDNMPALVIAEVESVQDPVMDVLRGIKNDPVLEYIPVILVSKIQYGHAIFDQATAKLIGHYTLDQLSFNIASIMIDVEHQLDINPFSALPGHHTSLLELSNAITLGGNVTVCTVQIHNLGLFGSLHGALSADVLADRIVQLIRVCVHETFTRKWLVGQLGGETYVALLPDDKAQAFIDLLTNRFDQSYAEMTGYATQNQFSTLSDALKNQYAGTTKVALSIVTQSLNKSDYRSAEALVHAAIEQHHLRPGAESLVEQSSVKASGGNPADVVKHFLDAGRVETYFQPIVDCWEKTVFAYEALSRFILNDGSFVHPEVLFSAARESGRILEMDILCLESAMKNFSKIKSTAKLFLNVDRATFTQLGDRVDLFDGRLIDPHRLVLELTEQSLTGQRHQIAKVKALLQDRGISIAFDDAGTGDVSFREAGEIKPDFIKFDRKLITGITRSPLKQRHVLSMRAFARGIGAQTIAEGIEMPSDLDFVKKIRIPLAQGYFIGRPQKGGDL